MSSRGPEGAISPSTAARNADELAALRQRVALLEQQLQQQVQQPENSSSDAPGDQKELQPPQRKSTNTDSPKQELHIEQPPLPATNAGAAADAYAARRCCAATPTASRFTS